MAVVTWTVTPPPASGTPASDEMSAVAQAKAMLFVDTAVGDYLTALGTNMGIPRPPMAPTNDDIYRRVIQALAFQPKTVLRTVYAVMGCVFGSQASIIAAGTRPWRVYEVNANEFIIEIPIDLLSTSNDNATYLHGWRGKATSAGGPSNTFTTPGDVRVSAVSLDGLVVQILQSGTYTSHTIAAGGVTYDAGTDTSTIVVTASTIPALAGVDFFIDVPGDSVLSYAGDFLATSGYVSPFSSAAGPATTTITLPGDATAQLATGVTVNLTYNASTVAAVVVTRTYDPTSNTTAVVLVTTVPGGVVGGALVLPLEEADGTNVPHGERVYLTGDGLMEIAEFYYNLLARASGVVLRVEKI